MVCAALDASQHAGATGLCSLAAKLAVLRVICARTRPSGSDIMKNMYVWCVWSTHARIAQLLVAPHAAHTPQRGRSGQTFHAKGISVPHAKAPHHMY
jgi:hypothetical protein